ncbi:lipopolysaccharide cholinephosphotransferase [Lacrimispora amygdalina]|uniref:Lipopolysaccharide cholinephosphotransferase n=1 Tax=Lacrimispora amygdalina TaxID=253257 RepID=A0A3E2ND77_9FIRM|nr:LicD family protein [Clostridium indicum]RFZ78979.1 lipopolysaccharide cholinephosphotransferase [Clostridium indicum]
MKEYDLTKVHQANLRILKEIDRICRKHRIQYLLDAGTLLGAVRHKGFIPWDDDADVAFTRPNYQAFLRVVRSELPEDMELLEPGDLRGGKAFYDFTARIIYKKSRTHDDTAEMKYYEGRLNHLWVDLFTIDELPKNRVASTITLLLHTVIYGLSMGHRYKVDLSKYSLLNKICVGILALAGKLIPMSILRKLQYWAAVKDRKGKSGLRYYSNYQPDYLYVTLKKEWCEETVDLEFEDTRLMAPKGWHEVLTWIYGDYKKLPPKEKQVPTHSSTEIQIFE